MQGRTQSRIVSIALLTALCSCGGRTVSGSGISDGSADGGARDSGVDAIALDSAAARDGARDAPAVLPDAAWSDPGLVTCKDTLCKVPPQFCCVEDDGVGDPNWQCMEDAAGVHCVTARHCDEAADCADGQRCCLPITAKPYPLWSARCASKCSGGQYFAQLCQTSAECKKGARCVEQTCAGLTIRACGYLQAPYCP